MLDDDDDEVVDDLVDEVFYDAVAPPEHDDDDVVDDLVDEVFYDAVEYQGEAPEGSEGEVEGVAPLDESDGEAQEEALVPAAVVILADPQIEPVAARGRSVSRFLLTVVSYLAVVCFGLFWLFPLSPVQPQGLLELHDWLAGVPSLPDYGWDYDAIRPIIWQREDWSRPFYLRPLWTMRRVSEDDPTLYPAEPDSFFSEAMGARIDSSTTSPTWRPWSSRIHRMVWPQSDRSLASPSAQDVLQENGRWCSGPGIVQLGIYLDAQVVPQRLTLAMAPAGKRPVEPRIGYVELWARMTDVTAHERMRRAISLELTHQDPADSLLGEHSFGMDGSYYRIGLFGIPAPSDADWLNSTWEPPLQRLDIPINLLRAGLLTNHLVVRVTLGGPRVCISRLGLRAVADPRAPKFLAGPK
jgi:hypothetical protein